MQNHSAQPVSWRYLAQEAVLFIGFAFLLIFNGTNNDFVNPIVLWISAGLLAVFGVGWTILGTRGYNPLTPPLMGWAVLYSLSVANSLDPRRSATQMLIMMAAVFIFALTAELVGRGWPAELVTKTLLLVGAVIVVFGWAEAGAWYAQWLQAAPGQWIPDIIYRPASANILAMMFNLLALTALARLIQTPSKSAKVFLGILILATLGLLFLTSSRGGWLGLGAGLVALALLVTNSGLLNIRPLVDRLRYNQYAGILILMLILGAAGAFGMILYQQTQVPTHGPILTSRQEYWGPAWSAFLGNPLFGQGPFSFAGWFMKQNSVPPTRIYVHAHGTPFNLLGEMGVAGVMGMGWVVGAALYSLRRRIRNASGSDRAVAVAAAAAFIAIAVHSLFDGFNADPVGMWAFAILLGAALGRPQQIIAQPKLWQRPFWTLLVAAGMAVELWTVLPLYQANSAAKSGDWSRTKAALEENLRRDPYSTIAYHQLGLTNSILAEQGDAAALDAAIANLEKTIAREPDYAVNYVNLGALYAEKDDLTKAQASMSEAVKRAPRCSVCWLNLGETTEAARNDYAAKTAYEQVLSLEPGWANSYYFRATEFRKEFLAGWRQAHPEQPAASIEELRSALAGHPQQAEYYIQLAQAEVDAGSVDEADALLKKGDLAYFDQPWMDLSAKWAKAEVAAARGDLKQAIQLGESALDGYRSQGVWGPGSFGMVMYGPQYFRRPMMAVEWAPQTTLITLTDTWGERLVRLGDWYAQAGQKDAAAKAYAEALETIPDLKSAQQRLAQAGGG